MEQLEQQEIFEKFKVIKKRQYVAVVPMLLVVFLAVALSENENFSLFGFPSEILWPIAALGIIIGLVFSLKNWRCPACNAYLKKNANPIFCPKCGVKLQDK